MIIAQDYCPFDGPYGQIGFLLCSDGKTVVLMCNECNAIWLNPEHLEGEEFVSAQPPKFVVAGTECSMKFPDARWATRNEVIQYGWEKFIVDENSEL